jgi:hypothetical protein
MNNGKWYAPRDIVGGGAAFRCTFTRHENKAAAPSMEQYAKLVSTDECRFMAPNLKQYAKRVPSYQTKRRQGQPSGLRSNESAQQIGRVWPENIVSFGNHGRPHKHQGRSYCGEALCQ